VKGLARGRAEGVVVVGGSADASAGWFVDPTVLEVSDPLSLFLAEELFAPVLTTYAYDDAEWDEALRLVDQSTPYGLTGPVVGQQPFGGARASATNDKPGTVWNMIRFASPRVIKRNHLPATDYRYPHLDS